MYPDADIIRFGMTRRQFIAALAAGWVVTASGLWMPGRKLISIPPRALILPPGMSSSIISSLSSTRAVELHVANSFGSSVVPAEQIAAVLLQEQ